MRSITQLKQMLLEQIANGVRRPGMHGGNVCGTERFFLDHLYNLLFIDEREGELMIAVRKGGMFKSCGTAPVLAEAIYGRFDRAVPPVVQEMGSLYAEIAYGLGYLKLDRVLKPSEWEALKLRLSRGRHRRNWSTDQIKVEFGPPSLEQGGNWERVLCYVSDEPARPWLYLDHGVNQEMFYGPRAGQEEPEQWLKYLDGGNSPGSLLLRDIRWQTGKGWRVLHTRYGRRILEWVDSRPPY